MNCKESTKRYNSPRVKTFDIGLSHIICGSDKEGLTGDGDDFVIE